jgi:hypothetical protein
MNEKRHHTPSEAAASRAAPRTGAHATVGGVGPTVAPRCPWSRPAGLRQRRELAPSSKLAGDDAGRHQAAQVHIRLEFGRAVGPAAHVQRANLRVDAPETERSIVTSGLSSGERTDSAAPATPGGRPCRPGRARRCHPGGPHGQLWPSRRAWRPRSLRRWGVNAFPSLCVVSCEAWAAAERGASISSA